MSVSQSEVDDLVDIDVTLMTLRKPTELKKVIDSLPKPTRAVPKNGLPFWHKLGLESKLPVPKMPKGKVVFSRGKLGEDVRRLGLGKEIPAPSFDLSDPYCNNVSYDYIPMHDPHLTHHFSQKLARTRMQLLGFCTKDGRAVCSLKDFNQYRKYLYYRFMDRIHMEMKRLDERAKDDLTLKRVEADVARRQQAFFRQERGRVHLEKLQQLQSDTFEEKRKLVKEKERKAKAHLKYLAEYNEHLRKERAAKAYEKETRIRQRVKAASELEFRRKITMVRLWRVNEHKRIAKLKRDNEEKKKRMEEEAEKRWAARVAAQNHKIQEEALLLKLYTEDMAAGAMRRLKKAEVYAYNTDLVLQRIRLTNMTLIHGGHAKEAKLIRKMGKEFQKSKRGVKGMCEEVAQQMAQEAMSCSMAARGDTLMILGQARTKMDQQTVIPRPPVQMLEEMLENAIVEFARRKVHQLLGEVERVIHDQAALAFFVNLKKEHKRKRAKKQSRWTSQPASEKTKMVHTARGPTPIVFGEVVQHASEEMSEIELKRTKDRPPTPIPSKTKLAEVTFCDKLEDLPEPVAIASFLPERNKCIEMVNAIARLLSRSVSQKVQKGLDVTIGKITLPRMRHPMDWGEAVEGLAEAVVDNRVNMECGDVRRASDFLSHRILHSLVIEMKELKNSKKCAVSIKEEPEDFYVPQAHENQELPLTEGKEPEKETVANAISPVK